MRRLRQPNLPPHKEPVVVFHNDGLIFFLVRTLMYRAIYQRPLIYRLFAHDERHRAVVGEADLHHCAENPARNREVVFRAQLMRNAIK